jgi:F-type H+-transporting ATPase subunit b
VLTAVVTLSGDSLVAVRLQTVPDEPPSTEAATAAEEDHGTEEAVAAEGEEHATTEEHALEEGPSPIAPELKELAWGTGAFVVLALVMRYAIWPKLSRGMKARYDSIEQGYTDADTMRESAKGDVAAYEAALAGVRAEAGAVVEEARQVLEGERQAKLAEVNAQIAERKAAAAAEVEAARRAAEGQVNDAVGTVAARLVELVTGNVPSADAVRSAVDATAATGARS